MSDARSRIPAVDTLLASPAFESLIERAGRGRVADAVRAVQAAVRADAGHRGAPPSDPGWYVRAAEERIEREDRPSLRRVINATGVVLHTNLGRAPLPEAARGAISEACGYTTLEYDEATGSRGSRHDHCVALLRELTGAEAALVVNNNAAAVVLALNTLADGAEAVISRGELVEIGGAFRVPEIMARSGVRMREVGSTNRTHLRDYEGAIGAATGAVLKIHRSNFKVEGFVAEVGVEELAPVTRQAGVPLIHDLGSGALMDMAELGLPHEPTAREALAAGADIVTMSGDKLLGGPQAGIVLGRVGLIDRLRTSPLCRALRCDKLTLAALAATLALYRDPERARREIPVLRMLGASEAGLAARASGLVDRLVTRGAEAAMAPAMSTVGGGAYPGVELATTVVTVRPGPDGAEALARRLRTGAVAVVARVREGQVLLDPRTVDPSEEALLIDMVVAALDAVPALGAHRPHQIDRLEQGDDGSD
jgi:L-seryl-tRNA(Ser) seleniumtransferase